MTLPKADDFIRHFKLNPHPEGGHYVQSYASPRSTAIHFLLTSQDISKIHRLKSDEIWHFYFGGPLTIVEIATNGKTITTVLGQDFPKGEKFQHTVKAGHWFGAFCNEDTPFIFFGCTMAPGFKFEDFEIAKREDVIKFLSPEYNAKFFPT